MMGICTTLIGVLPTYAQIGVFAPILLVTLRIIQGLGAGAEISGAGTMLAEYAPKGKRGIISSFVAMGTNCGTLSATAIWAFMFFILSKEELLAWGWRIPFLASVVVMVFAIWLRMNLKESPVFEKVNDSNQPTAKPAPAGSMFQSKSFWLATGLRFGQAGNSGLIQTFLAGYLVQTLLFNKAIPTDALMISSILGFMTIPFLGWLSDKIGRRIPYIIMNTSAIVLAWPMLSIIVDKSYAPSTIMVALIVIHNCAVLGLLALLLALLVIVATALTWMNFSQALPRSQWAQAAWSPDINVIEQMIFHYSLLPRLAISLLVGAGLGLVGNVPCSWHYLSR